MSRWWLLAPFAALAIAVYVWRADADTRRATLAPPADVAPKVEAPPSPVASPAPRTAKPLTREDLRELLNGLEFARLYEVHGAVAALAVLAPEKLPPYLLDKDPARRKGALTGMRYLGARGAFAVPFLVKALQDGEAPVEAYHALGAIGADAAPAVPLLIAGLKRYPKAAADALAALGPVARDAAPALAKNLAGWRKWHEQPPVSSPDWGDAGSHEARALVAIDASAAIAVPALRDGMRVPGARRASLQALVHFGPRAAPARAEVLAVVTNAEDLLAFLHAESEASFAIDALAAMGPAAADLIPALVPLARRVLVVSRALAGIDPSGRTVLPLIRAELDAGAEPCAGWADYFGRIRAWRERERLAAWLTDADVAADAVHALGKFGRRARSTAPAIARAVRADTVHPRTAIWALHRMRADVGPLVPVLEARVDSGRGNGHVDPRAARGRWVSSWLIPGGYLPPATKDPRERSNAALAAMAALGEAGAAAKPALPTIYAKARGDLAQYALPAAARIDPGWTGRAADLLATGDERTVWGVLDGLAKLPPQPSLLPVLRDVAGTTRDPERLAGALARYPELPPSFAAPLLGAISERTLEALARINPLPAGSWSPLLEALKYESVALLALRSFAHLDTHDLAAARAVVIRRLDVKTRLSEESVRHALRVGEFKHADALALLRAHRDDPRVARALGWLE